MQVSSQRIAGVIASNSKIKIYPIWGGELTIRVCLKRAAVPEAGRRTPTTHKVKKYNRGVMKPEERVGWTTGRACQLGRWPFGKFIEERSAEAVALRNGKLRAGRREIENVDGHLAFGFDEGDFDVAVLPREF